MPKEIVHEEPKKVDVVTSVEVTLKVKDKATAETLKVYDSKKWSAPKKELKFNKKISPKDRSWRLVHDGEKVLMLFESVGETHTVYELFCGTKEDCQKEVEKLGLKNKGEK